MARRELGVWFRVAVAVLRPFMVVFTKQRWQGAEHLPPAGGAIVCSNHISHFDPLTLAHFLYDNGRIPRFFAKASLFRVPLVGLVLRSSGQIPVYRDSQDAVHALSAAVAAVRRGECIALYPEGTLTVDPAIWPMTGKTGAARIALMTGAPLIPVAQWGPQQVLPRGGRFPRLLPRRTMHVVAGPSIDLTAFADREVNAQVLAEATELIMSTITALLAPVRGEAEPAVRMQRMRAPRLPALMRRKSPDTGESSS